MPWEIQEEFTGEGCLPPWGRGELQAFPSGSGILSFYGRLVLSCRVREIDRDAQGQVRSAAPWPCDPGLHCISWIHFLYLEKM